MSSRADVELFSLLHLTVPSASIRRTECIQVHLIDIYVSEKRKEKKTSPTNSNERPCATSRFPLVYPSPLAAYKRPSYDVIHRIQLIEKSIPASWLPIRRLSSRLLRAPQPPLSSSLPFFKRRECGLLLFPAAHLQLYAPLPSGLRRFCSRGEGGRRRDASREGVRLVGSEQRDKGEGRGLSEERESVGVCSTTWYRDREGVCKWAEG